MGAFRGDRAAHQEEQRHQTQADQAEHPGDVVVRQAGRLLLPQAVDQPPAYELGVRQAARSFSTLDICSLA